MLALYRSGRQADALEAYRHAREVLVEHLGIEPGVELHDLQQAMLAHDPALAAPGGTATPRVEWRSGLPVPPNRLIGRGEELRALRERLRAGSVRLLTLTGPGGVGKTRLALEVARAVESEFSDGAHFVSLAGVQRPQDVAAAIVKSLEIIPGPGESAEQAVERFLGGKHLLLVLDNCEHVLAAAPFIGGLPAACPAVTVLATSRESLSVQAERCHPLSALALPALATAQDPEALASVDAVGLFCDRAQAHDPGFHLDDANASAVAEICRRVDGLPLAVELAAARCALLSPGEIAERLRRTLGALGTGTRDAPARHHTLRATIDWSYGLLGDGEKAGFARFAVFAGAATIEAAERITGTDLDVLNRLVAKSLIVRARQTSAPTRLLMLETIRTYAAERLEAGADSQAAHERHYDYFLALARCHGSERALWGRTGNEQLARLDAEVDNLHAALGWAAGQDSAEPALQLCVALGHYWLMRDRYEDAVHWIDETLTKPGARVLPEQRVRALCTKAWALAPLGRGTEQSAVMTEAESIARALEDPTVLSRVLQARACQEAGADHATIADTLADEAVRWADAARDQWTIAMAAFAKAMAADSAPALRDGVDRASALLTEVGNVYWLADLLASSAYTALCLGSDTDAGHFLSNAIPLVRRVDNPYQWTLLRGNIGLAALLTGDAASAHQAFHEELTFCRERVVLLFAHEGLAGLAAVASVRGDDDRAARLSGAANAHRYGQPADRLDARLEATFLEPARTRHGTEAWDASAREGGTLSFEEAISYALEEPPMRRRRPVEHFTIA